MPGRMVAVFWASEKLWVADDWIRYAENRARQSASRQGVPWSAVRLMTHVENDSVTWTWVRYVR